MYFYNDRLEAGALRSVMCSEGLAFGFSVFETMKISCGAPEHLPYHIERIQNSCEKLGICLPCEEELTARSLEYSAGLDEGMAMKLQAVKSSDEPLIVFSSRDPGYTKEIYDNGFNAKISNCVRDENATVTYHKTSNYITNLIEKRAAASDGYDEAIFLNTKGFVSEGCTTNIFFSHGDEIFTPSLESGILPGVIRRIALESITSIVERKIRASEIESFDGAVLTNSLVGVVKLNSIGFARYSDSETLYRKMSERIASHPLR